MALFKELFVFCIKQARACIFAGTFFLLLFISHFVTLGLLRYDFLFLSAVLLQLILVLLRIETIDELKVIFLFHIVGLLLELFKTHPAIHSWSYPETAFFKIGNVPLYSGFMYAAVASYIIQSWRILKLHLTSYPPYWLSIPIAVCAYLNFFTHHFFFDIRWFVVIAVMLVFYKTQVYFTVIKKQRKMPLLVSFLLIAFFIWIAENIATYLGAWQYANQTHGWQMVNFGKINAWFLLFIISFLIVADLKFYKERRTN